MTLLLTNLIVVVAILNATLFAVLIRTLRRDAGRTPIQTRRMTAIVLTGLPIDLPLTGSR